MGEDRIYPAEFLLLGLWLGGPALILGLGIQATLLWRQGLGRAGERSRLGLTILASGILSYLLTFVVWIVVPPKYMAWPGTPGDWPFMFLGAFFVPTLLALLVVCPSTGWWAIRKRRSSPTKG